MVGRQDHHLGKVAAIGVDGLQNSLEQRLGEGAASTRSWSCGRCARSPRSGRSASAVRCVQVQLSTQASRLTSHRSGRGHCSLARQSHSFNVALQFQHLFGLEIGHFRATTCFFHDVGAARNADNTVENLQVVADALSRRLGLQSSIVTVDHLVRSVSSGQGITLPLVKISGSSRFASGRGDRCFSGGCVEDLVNQIFAVTLEGSFLI